MSKKLTYQEKLLQMAKRHKKSTGKHVFIGLGILLLFIFGFELFFTPNSGEAEKKPEAVFTASFVGDMMFGRHVQDVERIYGVDHLFKYVKPYFEESDYVTGNFENPVLTRDEKSYEKIDKQIHLYTGIESIQALKKLNFTNINLANNHIMDYGEEGLLNTTSELKRLGLDFVGAGKNLEEATNVHYSEFNGLKVATLGYTDVLVEGFSALGYRGGVARMDPKEILPIIHDASENADLVFVNVHWGEEYDKDPHPRQRKLGKAMIDAGADVIIGHHPHVLSEVEKYKNGIIFYSLGNFIFDQGWTRTKDSALVQYHLLNDGTGRFEIIPLRIRGAQPYVTKNKYYQKKIMLQLTRNQSTDHFKKESGKIIIDLDHSEVKQKEGTNSEQ